MVGMGPKGRGGKSDFAEEGGVVGYDDKLGVVLWVKIRSWKLLKHQNINPKY